MPIYEYECTHCSKTFELMQKIQDPPVKQCPVCLKDTVKRLVSCTTFQLKGTGWYETDFKNKQKPVQKTAKEVTGEKKADSTQKTSTVAEKKSD